MSPIVVVPPVQVSAPTAAPTQDQPSAPEVDSDAETLALPGIPGTEGNGPPPSPVEEEPQSATVDPYVSTVEDTTEEITSTDAPQAPAPTGHESLGTTSERPIGFGGLVPVIPKPSTLGKEGRTPKPVATTTEEAPKEVKETTPSEPAIQPTVEIGTGQPPTGKAEASTPPTGEADPSKSSVEEKNPDNPETAPKAKAKSVSTRKQKETPKETPEQKEQREKAEKAAEELVQQEEDEKRKQDAKGRKVQEGSC